MKDTKTAQTVVVADSHAIIREGIKARLEQTETMSVIAEASDGYSTIKACRENNPDILLMDFFISRPSGRDLLVKIKKTCPEIRVIILFDEVKISDAFFCLTNGALAIVTKQSSGVDFVNATNAVIRGYTYMPSDFIAAFLEVKKNLTKSGNMFALSPRELEIVDSCIDGRTTKDIAEALRISVRTVETHKSNIYRKTSCRNLDELSAEFSRATI
jgi:DNA-binding NarL/FixJ family response regulator